MDMHLPPPNNMKISIAQKENQGKRKRINKEKSTFSTSQNVVFLAEDQKETMLNKPPFRFDKTDQEILNAVLAELSIFSNPINLE